jgi:site-specific recombinase XerD
MSATPESQKTAVAYTDAALRFAAWGQEHGLPTTSGAVERRHVEAFIIDQIERHSPSTAAGRYRYLQQFWRWVVAEGERATSPMAGMRLDSLARDEQAVLVVGKGDRGRWVPYSDKAATALDRCLRVRRRHPQAELEWFWIGQRGRLSSSGITQVLRRRAKQAGVTDVRPHRFRHEAAHRALDGGMAEGDVQEIFGWQSPQMLARYGSSARAERARRTYRRVDLEADL